MTIIRVVNRSRGYLGRREPEPGEGMLLARCNAVHMYGLGFPLDLVFLDKDGQVVKTVEGLQPWKRTKRVSGARFALELPQGVIHASDTRVGDRLTWTQPERAFSPPPRLDDFSVVELDPWLQARDMRHRTPRRGGEPS